jgi:serine/threonine-protein kinase HipA
MTDTSAASSRFDSLWLWNLQQPHAPRCVGELRLQNIGKGVSLQYASDWIANGFALSEDLALTEAEHFPQAPAVAVGAVDDARPDRWGERVIQFIDKPQRLSLMEYLYFAGDDRFGALGVSLSAQTYLPRRNGRLPRLADAQALSEVMRKVAARETLTQLERRMVSACGSFGGAKPKALINADGVEWVLKFFNGEPIDVPLIEHASMTLAAQAGIQVAQSMVVPLAGENALAVRRFDRRDGLRIHCLSAGTVLRAVAAAGEAPDLGYPNLAQWLRRSGDPSEGGNQGRFYEQDMRELFRRMVFNILIDNTDDHEKNHAVMRLPVAGGVPRYRLSPAYDVLPTNSGQGQQEFGVGLKGRDSTLTNAMSQCNLFGLSGPDAAQEVMTVIRVVDVWKTHFADCGVTARDIESVAERIDGDALGGQRRRFDPAVFAQRRVKPRRSPFL